MKKGLLLIVLAIFSYGVANAQKTEEKLPGYKTSFQANSFWDNWFISGGAGSQVLFAESCKHADFLNRMTLAGSLSVGKWFAPWWGARLQFNGGTLHGFRNKATKMLSMPYVGAHADFMFGLLNFFTPYREDRKFEIVPFVGIGGQSYDNQGKWEDIKEKTMTINAGFQFKYDFCKNFGAWIEAQGVLTDDGYIEKGERDYDGIAHLTGGITYYFGKGNEFVKAIDAEEYNLLKRQNGDLIDEITALRNRKPEVREVVREVVKDNTVYKSVPTTIPFLFNSAVIQPLQKSSVFNIADFLKNNGNAKIRLSGYADKIGGVVVNRKLSEKRAKAVANELIKTYGIDADRIIIEFFGKDRAYYGKDNKWNRCVVVEVIK